MMKSLGRKWVAALVSLTLVGTVYGAPRVTHFRWDAPLERDGTDPAMPLAPAEIGGYRIFHIVNTQRVQIAAPAMVDTALTMTLDYAVGGRECFVMTALDVDGLESLESNVACVDVWSSRGGAPLVLRPPKPPANLRVD